MATVLRVGQLIDGKSDSPLQNAEIRFEGRTITGVGAHGTQSRPGDRIEEHPDATATAGFIDLHTHICYLTDGPFQKNATEPSRVAMLVKGFETARAYLEQGVTTVRDVGTPFDLDIEIKELIEAGVVPGPRMVTAGRMMTMTGGKRTPWDYMKEEVTGETAAREWTRKHLKDGADVIKLYCTTLLEEDVGSYLQRVLEQPPGAPDPGRWASLTVDEIRAAVTEAHKAGRTVAAHAAPAFGVKLALRGGVDTVEHGSDLDDECIELFLQSGATLVPTLSISHHQIANGEALGLPEQFVAFSKKRWQTIKTNVKKAYDAGVKIGTGTDPVLKGMAFASEIELLVECGLPPMEAIRCATSRAAACLGLAGQGIGVIEVGNRADIVVLDGNPLQDITQVRNVRQAWKDGRLVSSAKERQRALHA
jgi:imidazolonepropionase-like amidohydrolase